MSKYGSRGTSGIKGTNMLRGNFPVLVYPEDSSTSREWSKTAPPMRIKMQVGAGFDVPKNFGFKFLRYMKESGIRFFCLSVTKNFQWLKEMFQKFACFRSVVEVFLDEFSILHISRKKQILLFFWLLSAMFVRKNFSGYPG